MHTHARDQTDTGHTRFWCVTEREVRVCCGNPSPRTGLHKKHATPISQPVWLGVGIEDPSGVVEIQAHSRGTLEKISTYIFSHKYMHVHTRPFHHIVCCPLIAGRNIPREIHQRHEESTQPACGPMQWQWRVPTPNPGTHSDRGYIPRRRRWPKSATPLPLKTPPTLGVTGQRHPLQFILEHLYVEDDPSP